jgi:nitroreductase
MDVFEAVQQRSSIRAYEDKPVPREKLERILEAGRLAPSARNAEPWHFIVVTAPEKRKTLSKGRFAKFVEQAPVVIVACGDKKASPDWYAIDVALAVENMVLTAVSEGLSTCCVGSFDEKEVHAAVDAPENFEVLLLLPMGYSKDKLDISSKLRSRKTLTDVTSQETYGNKFVSQKVVTP